MRIMQDIDLWHMQRALAIAAQGQGFVEPNPMVGCIIARGAEIIGEGWHHRFGEAHAEVEALRVAGERAAGATLYVTLEPCCHQGKTPPCSKAVIAAGIRRVVVAMRDPFPKVQGGGIAELEAAGIEVEVGLLEAEARRLNAPYLKLLETGRPWVIAKWAMSLDGKIATATGESRWISNEQSRAIVHKLRGRVDAILVGRGTVEYDNPLLLANPPGPRVATRVVADTHASICSSRQVVQTAKQAPVILAVGEAAANADRRRLREAGCEVLVCPGEKPRDRLEFLLDELGSRHMTNILVEGGSQFFGSLFDCHAIDEAHIFIAPKLIGGTKAPSPFAGRGIIKMSAATLLESPVVQQLGDDVYITGRCSRKAASCKSREDLA